MHRYCLRLPFVDKLLKSPRCQILCQLWMNFCSYGAVLCYHLQHQSYGFFSICKCKCKSLKLIVFIVINKHILVLLLWPQKHTMVTNTRQARWWNQDDDDNCTSITFFGDEISGQLFNCTTRCWMDLSESTTVCTLMLIQQCAASSWTAPL